MQCNNNELKNLFDTNYRQKQFDSLAYEEKIKLLEELTGASFEGAKIDGIQLFTSDKEAKIAPCGQIYSSNGIASIKISDEMVIDNIKVNKKDDGFDLNVININGINPNFDYKKVYNFWRHEYDLEYSNSFNNSDFYETIEWTERRKKSTVDKDSIFYIGNPYSHILDPIYYDSKISLNARRLQMKYVLSQIASNPDEILKGYDFNIREVDVQPKKR